MLFFAMHIAQWAKIAWDGWDVARLDWKQPGPQPEKIIKEPDEEDAELQMHIFNRGAQKSLAKL